MVRVSATFFNEPGVYVFCKKDSQMENWLDLTLENANEHKIINLHIQKEFAEEIIKRLNQFLGKE